MSDVDELAEAANHAPRISIPARQIKRCTGAPATVATVLGGLAALWLVAWIVVRSMSGSSIVPTAMGGHDDPQFSIHRKAMGMRITESAQWIITNEIRSPLIIHRVRINDEFDCPIARMAGGDAYGADDKSKLPVTLTIGGSAHFLEFFIGGGPAYEKKVIFVDIDTSRGNFRYSRNRLSPR